MPDCPVCGGLTSRPGECFNCWLRQTGKKATPEAFNEWRASVGRPPVVEEEDEEEEDEERDMIPADVRFLTGSVVATRDMFTKSGRPVKVEMIAPDTSAENMKEIGVVAQAWMGKSEKFAQVPGVHHKVPFHASFASQALWSMGNAAASGRGQVLIARSGNEILGGVQWHDVDPTEAHIDLVTVSPRNQPKAPDADKIRGLGTFITNTAIEKIRATGRSKATLMPLDEHAENFWRTQGFSGGVPEMSRVGLFMPVADEDDMLVAAGQMDEVALVAVAGTAPPPVFNPHVFNKNVFTSLPPEKVKTLFPNKQCAVCGGYIFGILCYPYDRFKNLKGEVVGVDEGPGKPKYHAECLPEDSPLRQLVTKKLDLPGVGPAPYQVLPGLNRIGGGGASIVGDRQTPPIIDKKEYRKGKDLPWILAHEIGHAIAFDMVDFARQERPELFRSGDRETNLTVWMVKSGVDVERIPFKDVRVQDNGRRVATDIQANSLRPGDRDICREIYAEAVAYYITTLDEPTGYKLPANVGAVIQKALDK